jgi:large subunit ribosomal protein L24
MKKYSSDWNASKKPGKQRKYRYNAPLHKRRKLLSVTLSDELRKKYNTRNFPVRLGDKVKILRGDYKGKQGTVKTVDLKKLKVAINGIEKTKRDGTKVFPFIQPSNLMIIDLKIDDKLRQSALDRKKEPKKETKEKKDAKKTP